MERMTRPTVVVDPSAAKDLGDVVDIRKLGDTTLELVLNAPPPSAVRKDALRQMIRQLYEALADYEVAIQRLGLFGQLFVEYRGCPRGPMGRRAGPLEDEVLYMPVIEDVDGGRWIPVNADALHELVNQYRALRAQAERDGRLVALPCKVGIYAKTEMEAVLRAKHEYNKTRPYRHGGKAL